MTSTKPSEPSDEGKGGPIDCQRGRLRVQLRSGSCYWPHDDATVADIIGAGFVPVDKHDRVAEELKGQLTEAQAELERARQLVSEWADVANWLKSCGWHLPSFVLSRIGNLEAHIKGEPATPPSPPAAVEAKPEPHIQTSPFRQVAEASEVDPFDGRHQLARNCECIKCWGKCNCGRERTSVHEPPCPVAGPCPGSEPSSPAQEQPAGPNIVDTVNGYLKRAALEPHEPALDYVIDAVLELAAAVQERRQ
jgi:hypothetical protein